MIAQQYCPSNCQYRLWQFTILEGFRIHPDSMIAIIQEWLLHHLQACLTYMLTVMWFHNHHLHLRTCHTRIFLDPFQLDKRCGAKTSRVNSSLGNADNHLCGNHKRKWNRQVKPSHWDRRAYVALHKILWSLAHVHILAYCL